MLRSTFLLTLLSLQGVFASSGDENRAVVVRSTDSSRRDALPGYGFSRAQKRQGEEDDDDAAKRFSMPEVQTMPGDLSIENLEGIETVELPRLETVDGNLTVARNADLKNLTLPALRRVGGHLVLSGRFASIDLPALAEVGGTVSIATYGSGFNCTAFRDDLADVDVGGDFICQGDGDGDGDGDDDEEDENDGDGDNDDDNADEDDNDDNDDGEDTSGAAGSPRLGWLTLLAMPTLLFLVL